MSKNIIYAGLLPSSNFGDWIIEEATQRLLDPYLKDEYKLIHFHSHGNSEIPYEKGSKLIIPGCTQLTYGSHTALNNIQADKIKSFCIAGSLWYKYHRKGILIRKRIVGEKFIEPNLTIVNKLSGIIGCRDNFTFKYLYNKGYNCIYTGCPTLHLSDFQSKQEAGYILLSFGRGDYYKQIYYGNQLAKKGLPVIGIVHEINDYERYRAAGWKHALVDFNHDTELYLSYFKNADYVISGRLHGVLPAISYGKKVLYYGTSDTRTSILSDLGIPIYSHSDIPNFQKLAIKFNNMDVIDKFRSNLDKVITSILDY